MFAFRTTLASIAMLNLCGPVVARAQERFTLDQALAFPIADGLVAAPEGTRIAWIFEERGVRKVWGAEGPSWTARRLTQFDQDDGQEISQLSFSRNGQSLVFVRNAGGGNWASPDGVDPNPTGSPVAAKTQIWAVRFTGGTAHSLAEGDAPAISPRGDRVAFIRGGQAFVVGVEGGPPAVSLFFARGQTGSLTWSPDGSKLAFISGRGAHSLLGVFRSASDPILWVAPSSANVASPRWSPDGTRIAFAKLPGQGGVAQTQLDRHPVPWELWWGDAATGDGHVVWRSPATIAGSFPDTQGEVNLAWGAGDRLIFTAHLDGWPHLYSVPTGGGDPLLLTPGPFMVEYVTLSPDRRYVVYNANTGPDPADDDRRHVFRVAVDSPQPVQLTPGAGLEWNPVVTGDGRTVAFLAATARRSPLPTVVSFDGGEPKAIAVDRVPANFAGPSFVEPRKVVFRASDGLTIHGQLFEASASGAGQRAGLIFVHGGPPRQMLLGFHYMPYYARDYVMNQYLASRGFVVLAVNYRLGIGYGDAFNNPAAAGPNGASEYLDVVAGAKYLQAMPEVDPKRVGIWGGSDGGYLTALALARNSDVFAAGVDLHGVHNWITHNVRAGGFPAGLAESYDRPPDYAKALDIAWKSSPVADVERWRSPVLFIHGDDDRNVHVSQTVDLIERLKGRGVRFEELIIPDETHDWLLFRSWLRITKATAAFLSRELGTGLRP